MERIQRILSIAICLALVFSLSGFVFVMPVDAVEPLGSIRICKIIIDGGGNIVDGSERAGDTFGITLTGVGTANFTAPISLDEDLIDNGDDDAECVTFSDLVIQDYVYEEEVVTPAADWETPLYNDQFQTQVDTLADFSAYVFDGPNYDYDGHITLTLQRPDRTLVVLNQYTEPYPEEEPCCASSQLSIGNDYTKVKNNITAISNTGGNGIANSWNQKGGFSGDISSGNWNNTITTGNATAYAGAANVVNSNIALTTDEECCDYPKCQISAGNDYTKVKNEVFAGAYTGENSIAESDNAMGGFSGNISSNNDGNVITTGNAFSAAGAITVVNSNIKRSWGR